MSSLRTYGIDHQTARILQKVYTDDELEKLHLVNQIKGQENYRRFRLLGELPSQLAEGTPQGHIIISAGWDLSDDEIEKLVDHKLNSKPEYLQCLVLTCTEIGIMLSKKLVHKLLSLSADLGFLKALDVNQDPDAYEEMAKSSLEHDMPRNAFYAIRNHPKFDQYKDAIIKKCFKLAEKYKGDVATTIFQSSYVTIVLLCEQKSIKLAELEKIGGALLYKSTGWALTAYYLAGKNDKIRGYIAHAKD